MHPTNPVLNLKLPLHIHPSTSVKYLSLLKTALPPPAVRYNNEGSVSDWGVNIAGMEQHYSLCSELTVSEGLAEGRQVVVVQKRLSKTIIITYVGV